MEKKNKPSVSLMPHGRCSSGVPSRSITGKGTPRAPQAQAQQEWGTPWGPGGQGVVVATRTRDEGDTQREMGEFQALASCHLPDVSVTWAPMRLDAEIVHFLHENPGLGHGLSLITKGRKGWEGWRCWLGW